MAPRVVLDLAAGRRAWVYQKLLGRGQRRKWQYVGVDVRPFNVQRKGRNTPVNLLHADARGKLPFEDEFAHVVYLNAPTFDRPADDFLLPEHRATQKPYRQRFHTAAAFLRELHRVLKPGGRAVLAIDEQHVDTMPFLRGGEQFAKQARKRFERADFQRYVRDESGRTRKLKALRRLTQYPQFVDYTLVLKKAKEKQK